MGFINFKPAVDSPRENVSHQTVRSLLGSAGLKCSDGILVVHSKIHETHRVEGEMLGDDRELSNLSPNYQGEAIHDD